MLLLVSSLKLIAEIALLAFVGQWVLGVLAGGKRDANLMYQLLLLLTKPFVKGVRFITPSIVIDRHIPLAAFALMAMLWLTATVVKINVCLQMGVSACQ